VCGSSATNERIERIRRRLQRRGPAAARAFRVYARRDLRDLLAAFDALQAEHQGCLDGDEGWAAKWRQKYEALKASRQ
jgi:hypothetical protein